MSKNKPFPFGCKYLKKRLEYNSKTGLFKWRHSSDMPPNWNARRAGTITGQKANKRGYVQINITFRGKTRLYSAHRLAWFYMYGTQLPELDHIDNNKKNNRIDNLRPAKQKENIRNRTAQANNTSGYKGVWKNGVSWSSTIKVDGKKIHLGTYGSREDARDAYILAAKAHHKTYARWGRSKSESGHTTPNLPLPPARARKVRGRKARELEPIRAVLREWLIRKRRSP